jgi:hypothetical protein
MCSALPAIPIPPRHFYNEKCVSSFLLCDSVVSSRGLGSVLIDVYSKLA